MLPYISYMTLYVYRSLHHHNPYTTIRLYHHNTYTTMTHTLPKFLYYHVYNSTYNVIIHVKSPIHPTLYTKIHRQ